MSKSSSICFIRPRFGGGVDHAEVLRPGHLVGSRDEGADVSHAQLVLRPVAVAVEILSEGAEIEEEDGYLQARFVFLGQDRFLGGSHAANRGAIIVVAPVIARTDALDERQPLGWLAVTGTKDVSPRGARRPKATARTARWSARSRRSRSRIRRGVWHQMPRTRA